MNIRSETPDDYADIAAINVRAFGERLAEALMIALLRQRRDFDPALSLVAERDGVMVGHVLFTPLRVRLLGETVRAVLLAPIAVDTRLQKQGIGAALIDAGHNLAREKGYAFSMLVGHPTYYPRFGYQQFAFGVSSLEVTSAPAPALTCRGLMETDLPALQALWLAQEGGVDFALEPAQEMVDWLSPDRQVKATVYLRGTEIVGYSRATEDSVRYFLARDSGVARSMLAQLATPGQSVSLPVHPRSSWAGELGQAKADAWEVAMVCPLSPSPFEEYMRQVKAGARPAGRPIWSTAFDVE